MQPFLSLTHHHFKWRCHGYSPSIVQNTKILLSPCTIVGQRQSNLVLHECSASGSWCDLHIPLYSGNGLKWDVVRSKIASKIDFVINLPTYFFSLQFAAKQFLWQFYSTSKWNLINGNCFFLFFLFFSFHARKHSLPEKLPYLNP